MSRRDRDATRVGCVTTDCGALLQRERRGEDPELRCPRCSASWPADRWTELARLQPVGAP